MTLPLLEGVRVLELALLMPADQVGGLLADMGAEVIKVEQPPYGDYVRELGGVLAPGVSPNHLWNNRNKRSLAVDLRTPEGQEVFHKLVATADVVYESGTPGTKKKMGADYETCKKINPNIIYASFPPYGNFGPYSNMPAHGWGMSAFTNGSPIERMADGRLRVGQSRGGGGGGSLMMALAIAGAVIRKLKTGQGSVIDLAMVDANIWGQHGEAFNLLNNYPVQIPQRTPPGRSNPIRFTYYECKDGKVIAFQAVERKFWENFCRIVGHEEWKATVDWKISVDYGTDEPEIEKEMIKIFKTKPLQEWMKILSEADIPVSPGYTLPEVLKDSHVTQRGLVSEYDHPGFGHVKQLAFPVLVEGFKFKTKRPAPYAGWDNEDILKSLGYTTQEIQALRDKKVIAEDTRWKNAGQKAGASRG